MIGNVGRALQLYRELINRYPDDSRVPLALTQVGRLELERGNSARAATALEGASQSDGANAEDAAVRLVEAYDRLSDPENCGAAKARYLDRYPGGAHRKAVSKLCPSK